MAFVPLEQPVRAFVPLKLLDQSILPESLVRVFALLERPALVLVYLRPLFRAFVPLEQPAKVLVNLRLLVRVFVLLRLLDLAFVNPRQLLMMREKNSSSHPTVARSQIVQPGRSGIILKAESRSPLFDQLNPLR
jgi:hypothetical protein